MLLVQFFINFNKHFCIFCRSTVAGSAGLTHHLRAGSAFQFIKDIIQAFKFFIEPSLSKQVGYVFEYKTKISF